MHLSKFKPYIPCAVIVIVLAAFMTTTRGVLDRERQLSDIRYAEQQEAMRSLTASLEKQNAKLSRTIFNLQEQIDEMKFKMNPDIPLSSDLQEFTYYRSCAAGIEPNIIFAIMWRESRYQVDAVGYNTNGTTDIGLCQINSVNWDWLDAEGINAHEPQGNIQAAIRILSMHLEDYPMDKALAAYAVGGTGMERGGGMRYATEILEAAYEKDFHL